MAPGFAAAGRIALAHPAWAPSSLSRQLTWRPLGPEDNHEAGPRSSLGRKDVDPPPVSRRFGNSRPLIAGRDKWRHARLQAGTLRPTGITPLCAARRFVVRCGIGRTLLYLECERARHLVKLIGPGSVPGTGRSPAT